MAMKILTVDPEAHRISLSIWEAMDDGSAETSAEEAAPETPAEE